MQDISINANYVCETDLSPPKMTQLTSGKGRSRPQEAPLMP